MSDYDDEMMDDYDWYEFTGELSDLFEDEEDADSEEESEEENYITIDELEKRCDEILRELKKK